MKCLICGRNSVPGAKLCADCSSARKRAFAATVTQPLLLAAGSGRGAKRLLRPSQSIAATARRSAERALLAKPVVEAPPPAAQRRVGVVAFVAAALTVCVVGASVGYYRSANQATDSEQLAEQPATASRAPVAGVTSVPPQLAPKSVSETTSSNANAAAAALAPSSEPAKAEPPKRVATKTRAPPPEPLPTAPEPPPPTVAAAPVVEAPPPVREAPPVDPMQQMRDSLARCANGDLIDRILCDQRVRREYCATRWGLVPQCPSGVPNDRGQ